MSERTRPNGEETLNRQPTIDETAKLFAGPLGVRSIALTGLFILAILYTLYFAREFLLPVMLALLFNFLLGPVVRGMKRVHIPEFVGAALSILSVLGVIGVLLLQLSAPLSDWVARAPEITGKIAREIRKIKGPVEEVTKATEQVKQITRAPAGSSQAQPVEVKQPGVPEEVFYETPKSRFIDTPPITLREASSGPGEQAADLRGCGC